MREGHSINKVNYYFILFFFFFFFFLQGLFNKLSKFSVSGSPHKCKHLFGIGLLQKLFQSRKNICFEAIKNSGKSNSDLGINRGCNPIFAG